MKSTHRGYKIEVNREKCLGGWTMLYFFVTRISDGRICLDSFSDSDDTVKDMIGYIKTRIDNEHDENDPWNENGEQK